MITWKNYKWDQIYYNTTFAISVEAKSLDIMMMIVALLRGGPSTRDDEE